MKYRLVNVGIYLAMFVALTDQMVKWWIVNEVMVDRHVVPVTSFFNLVLSWNRGVTFGLFNRVSQWMPYIIMGAAVVIVLLLLGWLFRASSLLMALGLGAVMGGAVGNIIDRIRFGAVTDFLDFYAYGHHWPAFNIADSAIVCGVGLLLLENMVKGVRNK